MEEIGFDSLQERVVGEIMNRFLSTGQGTVARDMRVVLGPSRHVLDHLVEERIIRLLGEKYYPCFLALEALDPAVRDFVRIRTAHVLQALKALYERSGKDQFSFGEVLKEAQEIDPATTIERVNIGMLMASDFSAYVMTWGFGGSHVADNEGVSTISVREKILDYVTLDQAWEDEIRSRIPVAERKDHTQPSSDILDLEVVDFGPRGRTMGLSKADLHPWGIIFSTISRLSSDGVVSVVSGTGLQVDWTLTKEENYSHKTRVRTYLPRVQAAYDALPEGKRLIVAGLAAVELARTYPAVAGELITHLSKVGWRLEADRLIPTEPDVRELFFPKGSQHDAYVEIRSIVERANKSIVLIDPWVDSSLFPMLASITRADLEVHVLTSKAPSDFNLEAKKFLAQHTRFRIEVRLTDEFHDRFLVLDDAMCYHIGASLKDAGNKAFMISQIEDERNREALLAQHRQSWDAAKGVFP